MEPFLLPVMEGQEGWREDLDPKIQAVRKLAREFDALLIPLDGIFSQASSKLACTVWVGDGVHPTQAGHALITNANHIIYCVFFIKYATATNPCFLKYI